MTNRPKPYYSTHRRNLTPISSLSAFLEAVETAKASLSANQEYEEGVI